MRNKTVPGTVLPYTQMQGGMFAQFRPMIELADGLSLSQVCAITGLEPHTIQNWVKRGFVAHPVDKKYHARQLARILLISALRECMLIERVGELLTYINGNADDEGDDIISEEQLYDFLCEAVRQMEDDWVPAARIPVLMGRVTGTYDAPDEKARERLTTALEVMVCAYMSGRLKREAQQHFEHLQTM